MKKGQLIKNPKELEDKVNFHYVTGKGRWRAYSVLVETSTGPAKLTAMAGSKQSSPYIKLEFVRETELTDVHYKKTECGTWAIDYYMPDNTSDIKKDIYSGKKYYAIFEKLKDLVCMFDQEDFFIDESKFGVPQKIESKSYNGGKVYWLNPEEGIHAIPKGIMEIDVKDLDEKQLVSIIKYDGRNFHTKKYETTVKLNFNKLVGI